MLIHLLLFQSIVVVVVIVGVGVGLLAYSEYLMIVFAEVRCVLSWFAVSCKLPHNSYNHNAPVFGVGFVLNL